MNRKGPLFGSGHDRTALLALFSGVFAASAVAAPGDPLGPPIQLLDTPILTPDRPMYDPFQVVHDTAGNSLVVWPLADSNGVTSILYGQRFAPDGTALGAAFVIASALPEVNSGIAMNASGQFAVSWVTATSIYDDSIQAQIYQPDGTPSGSPIQISGNDLTLAMTASGKLVAAWDTTVSIPLGRKLCSLGGTPALIIETIKAQQFNADGTSASWTKTVDSLTYFGGCAGEGYPSAGNPSIAVDAAGNYVVSYQKDGHYFARRFSASGWALTAKIQTPVSAPTGEAPLVASDAAGNFMVATSNAGQLYTAKGQPNGGLLQLNGVDRRTALAMNGDGDFVVGWSGDLTSGNGSGVYVQRYAPTGSANGEPILVDSAIYDGMNTVYLDGPNLGIDANGNFSVTWARGTEPITNPPTTTFSNQFYLSFYEGP